MEHANPAAVVLLLLLVSPILWRIRSTRAGKTTFIRRIPGIDAIDEAIGRAVELGRPISFTTGLANVGPLLYACLGVLHYIGRKTATFGAKLIVPCSDPEVLVLSDATVQNAYRSERKSHRFDSSSLRYLSSEQFAFSSGYMGTIHREQVASAFLLGTFAAESLVLAEAGQQVGALQVSGTTSLEQIPFFLTACDYTLIGEEVFAAGAYLADDPVQRGSLRGQDLGKLLLMALVIGGVAWGTWSAAMTGKPATVLPCLLKADWERVASCF